MKTPPSSPTRTPPRTPQSPISCRGLLFPEKGGISEAKSPAESPAKSPPPQPRKPQKSRSNSVIYAWLPLLKIMIMSFCSKVLGKGDFGTVSEIRLPNPTGTPQSPPIAVKEIKFDTPGVCSSDLQKEVGRLGSPGCVPGVAYRTDESMRIFMPLGIPLDKLEFSKMTKEVLDWLFKSVNDLCMNKLDIGLLADIKPENFVLVPKETAIVIKDSEGQPCMGSLTTEDEVVYCDLGSVDPTSGGTKKYGVFQPESDAKELCFEKTLRSFKATMMEALICDAAKPSGKTVEQIVAPLVPPEWSYAGGVQHQAQGLQLRF